MSGTERKRIWRQLNPERRRQHERERAARRRSAWCSDENSSYWRYERTARAQILRMIGSFRRRALRGEISLGRMFA
jgi:hypothetical protein